MDCTVGAGYEARAKAGVVGSKGRAYRKKRDIWVKVTQACRLQNQDEGRYRWTVGAGTPKTGENMESR